MSELHDLIATYGVDRARATAADAHERRNVDAAARIMNMEEAEIAVTHAGFALTALPHRKQDPKDIWVKEAARTKLIVQSGLDRNEKVIGIPYGATARLILVYLQTEAMRTGSRRVRLGPSMNGWMRALGRGNGGNDYQQVARQAKRISACRLTFFYDTERESLRHNGAFVDTEISMFRPEDAQQQQLWEEYLLLNEHYYQSLGKHAVPLVHQALMELTNSSMALDVYIWLAYRLHVISKAVSLKIKWFALKAQFGDGYKEVRQFKPKFLVALRAALAVYPDANVEVEADGLLLSNSPPPISRRLVQVLKPN
jgi:hypothetical protein